MVRDAWHLCGSVGIPYTWHLRSAMSVVRNHINDANDFHSLSLRSPVILIASRVCGWCYVIGCHSCRRKTIELLCVETNSLQQKSVDHVSMVSRMSPAECVGIAWRCNCNKNDSRHKSRWNFLHKKLMNATTRAHRTIEELINRIICITLSISLQWLMRSDRLGNDNLSNSLFANCVFCDRRRGSHCHPIDWNGFYWRQCS